MGLKIIREYGRVSLAGTPTLRTVIVRTGRFRDRWEYLRVECGEYVAGGYAGVVNATTADDLVILPKIPGVDFVGMFSRCAGGGQMTADRLESIIYRFPEGRLVYLDGVGMDFLREYLVLLLGILVLRIREEGVSGIEGQLGVIGRFLETPFGISVSMRLEENGLDDDSLYGGDAFEEEFSEGDCLKGGKVGAAARVVGVVRHLQEERLVVMPFLVNMPLLFELYCLCLLRDGRGSYLYQKEFSLEKTCRYPDILDCGRGLLIDCKYKPQIRDSVDFKDIGQMGLYSLIEELREDLGYGRGFATVRILFLYPDGKGREVLRGNLWMRSSQVPGLHRVHRKGVRLPVLACDYDGIVLAGIEEEDTEAPEGGPGGEAGPRGLGREG